MKLLYSYLFFILLFSCQSLFAQFPEKDRTKIEDYLLSLSSADQRNENGNTQLQDGHIIDLPLKYCFINCFGEIYLWISHYPKDIKSKGYYRYNGKSYEISKYLPSYDIKTYDKYSPYVDLIVFADFGRERVSKLSLNNIISWDFGGCLGQAYPLIEDGKESTEFGKTYKDILPRLKDLYIGGIIIKDAYCRDYAIESAIREKLEEEKNIAKQKQIDSFYNEYLKEANAMLAQKDYEKARSKYKQASELKRNESYPTSKIAEIDKILDEQKNELKFNRLVADGDRYTESNKKTEARTAYREALKLKPNDTIVQNKLDALGKDPVADYMVEIEKMVFTGKKDISRSEPEWGSQDFYYDKNNKYIKSTWYFKFWMGQGSHKFQSFYVKGDKLLIKTYMYINHHMRTKNCDQLPVKDCNSEEDYTVECNLTDIKRIQGSTIFFKSDIVNIKLKREDTNKYTNFNVEPINYKSSFINIYLNPNTNDADFENILKKAVIAAGGKLEN